MKAKFDFEKKEVVTVVEEKVVKANFSQVEWNLLTLFVISISPAKVLEMFTHMRTLGVSNISQEGLTNGTDVVAVLHDLAIGMKGFTS